MKRLAYKLFTPPHIPGASVSTTHVVVMHGLLGCHRNWHSVCATLSSPYLDMAQASVGSGNVCFPCVAFDWRNHGDSAHMEDHSLSGLAEDLSAFLEDYATTVQQAAASGQSCASPSSTETKSPVDVVLMAHSMGAAALMYFLWHRHMQHVEKHRGHSTASSSHDPGAPAGASTPSTAGVCQPLPPNPSFENELFRIVGCVVVDMAPAPRPPSFHAMMEAVEFLPELPVAQLGSLGEMEKWLLEHGPKPWYTKENIWMIKYLLSNVDTSARRWKVGLDAIVAGTSKILWPFDNSVAALGSAAYPTMRCPPMKFIFGELSPYYNAVGVASIEDYFYNAEVAVIPGGSHFLFLDRKKLFCESVRNFCVAIHRDCSSVTMQHTLDSAAKIADAISQK